MIRNQFPPEHYITHFPEWSSKINSTPQQKTAKPVAPQPGLLRSILLLTLSSP